MSHLFLRQYTFCIPGLTSVFTLNTLISTLFRVHWVGATLRHVSTHLMMVIGVGIPLQRQNL